MFMVGDNTLNSLFCIRINNTINNAINNTININIGSPINKHYIGGFLKVLICLVRGVLNILIL